MDEQFTADQWENAGAFAVGIILEARTSARIATEMIRIWNQTQILDARQRDVNKAFSIDSKQR